jgi:UDP:flavonoid glycosyltransferase YjiC (YdhE family)
LYLLGQPNNNNSHTLENWKLGDVQPYVALGQQLVKDGHRIRIATHETFKEFVTGAGLEFFSIGGDPQDLMNYMVKSELSQCTLKTSNIIIHLLHKIPRSRINAWVSIVDKWRYLEEAGNVN